MTVYDKKESRTWLTEINNYILNLEPVLHKSNIEDKYQRNIKLDIR